MMPPATVLPREFHLRKDEEVRPVRRRSKQQVSTRSGLKRSPSSTAVGDERPSKAVHGKKLPQVITLHEMSEPKKARKSLFSPRKSRRKFPVKDIVFDTAAHKHFLDDSSCSSDSSFKSVPSEEFDHFEATEPLTAPSSAAAGSVSKTVSFGTVEVREYARCIGDNPSASPNGPSMSIDWDYESMGVVSTDEFEAVRDSKPPRTTKKLEPLSGFDRAVLIGFHTDCTKQDLDQSIRMLVDANEERKLSKIRFHLETIEETRRQKLGHNPTDKPICEMTNFELLRGLNTVLQEMKAQQSQEVMEQLQDDEVEENKDEDSVDSGDIYAVVEAERRASKQTLPSRKERGPLASKPVKVLTHVRWD